LRKCGALANEVRNGKFLRKVPEDAESSGVREGGLDNFGDNGHRLNENVCFCLKPSCSTARYLDGRIDRSRQRGGGRSKATAAAHTCPLPAAVGGFGGDAGECDGCAYIN
jgi:hypothetical protein